MRRNNTDFIRTIEAQLRDYWDTLEERCHTNFERVLQSFLDHGLSETHFTSVTGYGHDDTGRETTDAIFASAFQAESALVRLQFVSGTHAIAKALQSCLNHGDTLLSITGPPYDTLKEVIGTQGQSNQSLLKQGIHYQEINILEGSEPRLNFTPEEIQTIQSATVLFIQRSRGYSSRPSLSMDTLTPLIAQLKAIHPTGLIMVDNCFGEFTQTTEPPAVGADLIAGSLIKNPGGGLVHTGGYIAGKKSLVAAAADTLTAPGIGANGGYTFNSTRLLLQGLYLAPAVVRDALKGMSLAAAVFEELGYTVSPRAFAPQPDFIQIIHLGSEDRVLAFCKALQSVSPVDSNLTPVPAVPPGYTDPVVMAGGTFVFGSTIELSADAPMRDPYAVFLQGGLTYSHTRIALLKILDGLEADIPSPLSATLT